MTEYVYGKLQRAKKWSMKHIVWDSDNSSVRGGIPLKK